MKNEISVQEYIENIYPSLFKKISTVIRKSEKEYNGKNFKIADSFLWDHTIQVATFAYRLSLMEKVDPLIPVITALFHDSGKFVKGKYHADDRPEEDYSAEIARKILKQVKADKEHILKVEDALRTLYQDRLNSSKASSIVHDADFLVKFGYIGISNFFIKGALRGKPLQEIILSSLSKELTYSLTAEFNMMTKSGKKLAAKRSRYSLKFFDSLLSEIREYGTGNYRIKKVKLDEMERPAGSLIDDRIKIILVEPESCVVCRKKLDLSYSREKGVKCEKLIAKFKCGSCGKLHEISFCIPEISRMVRNRN
jgi:HD superfamily phosphodiesterase